MVPAHYELSVIAPQLPNDMIRWVEWTSHRGVISATSYPINTIYIARLVNDLLKRFLEDDRLWHQLKNSVNLHFTAYKRVS